MNYHSDLRLGEIILKKDIFNSLVKKTALVLTIIILMAVSANSFIYLPYTPIPLTLQVLTVLASGIFLGSRLAFFTQLSYIMLAIAGFPLLAGFKSGIAALAGPTGGFIIGFLFAAYITGYVYEKKDRSRLSESLMCFLSCSLGLLLIYLFGFIYLYILISKSISLGSAANIFKIIIIVNINKVITKNEKSLL
jgi:biotin transport system substrate-specific component